MHLVHTYSLLDDSFVNSWNESSSSSSTALTFAALQSRLNSLNLLHQLPPSTNTSTAGSSQGLAAPPLTDIQKADILVTQQWLRLVVWQSSMRQGLLSSTSTDPSMNFRYPLDIASSLLNIISSLPTTSIEVHGMGIFEKIFEVGCSMIDVLQASGLSSRRHASFGPEGEMRALTGGIAAVDPYSAFVKTLSTTPNSANMYARLLMAKAAEKPEIQRYGIGVPSSGLQLGHDVQGTAKEEAKGRDWDGISTMPGSQRFGVPLGVANRAPRGSVTELTEKELAALKKGHSAG